VGIAALVDQGSAFVSLLTGSGVNEQALTKAPGLSPSSWVRHVITVRNGVLTYEAGDEPAVTAQLESLEPGAERHFVLGLRAASPDWSKLDIRRVRVVALEPAP